ncbi:MAG: hypothetical protein H7289_16300 [Mucilaginibacter sp.]|nr:hypothetical protein [Mucilaginibacter sp.]
MKKLTLIILSVLGCTIAFGQKVTLTPVNTKSLKAILCNVDTVVFRSGRSTAVILYQLSNPSGSAHIPETDESSNKFLIAVTNGDEVPDQILYSVGDFLGPKILKFQALKDDKYFLSIGYGFYNHRKKINLDISISKISILK